MRPLSISDQIFIQDSKCNINITLMWVPEYQQHANEGDLKKCSLETLRFTELYEIVCLCVCFSFVQHYSIYIFFTTLSFNEGYSLSVQSIVV